jgi:type II secretory pathway component PulM
MDVVVVVVVLFLVVLVISAPLRRARRADAEWTGELAELEAAREAKYREIRDAELDHGTGKLSDADYQALDSTLRAEAVDILRQIDAVKERGASEPAPASSA